MDAIPLLIEFAAPSSLLRERDRPSAFPIVGNGPPGTFVVFPNGLRVSLPTDQIVSADDITQPRKKVAEDVRSHNRLSCHNPAIIANALAFDCRRRRNDHEVSYS
jgi:hypothetical protein